MRDGNREPSEGQHGAGERGALSALKVAAVVLSASPGLVENVGSKQQEILGEGERKSVMCPCSCFAVRASPAHHPTLWGGSVGTVVLPSLANFSSGRALKMFHSHTPP